jgi:hypothetical protein
MILSADSDPTTAEAFAIRPVVALLELAHKVRSLCWPAGDMGRAIGCALLALLACVVASSLAQPSAASAASAVNRVRAPRGWNSYNGWGHAVNESTLLAVADFVSVR